MGVLWVSKCRAKQNFSFSLRKNQKFVFSAAEKNFDRSVVFFLKTPKPFGSEASYMLIQEQSNRFGSVAFGLELHIKG